jgi:hypothetical protein
MDASFTETCFLTYYHDERYAEFKVHAENLHSVGDSLETVDGAVPSSRSLRGRAMPYPPNGPVPLLIMVGGAPLVPTRTASH